MDLKAAINKTFGRSLHIREVDAGSCNGCELEIVGLTSPIYDLERFGIHFVASPRHADMLLVTGPVTRNMELALRKPYAATPPPRLVVAVGLAGAAAAFSAKTTPRARAGSSAAGGRLYTRLSAEPLRAPPRNSESRRPLAGTEVRALRTIVLRPKARQVQGPSNGGRRALRRHRRVVFAANRCLLIRCRLRK